MHARGFGITGNGMHSCGIHLMLKGYLKNEFQVAFCIMAGSSVQPSIPFRLTSAAAGSFPPRLGGLRVGDAAGRG